MKDEKELIFKAKQKDDESFRKIIEKYKSMVFNLSFSILRDYSLSEDVSQDVFITVYKKLKTFNFNSSFSTWLYRITLNKCKDYLRKRKKTTVSLNENINETGITYEEFLKGDKGDFLNKLKKEEINKILDESISLLDERYRIILTLKEIEGLSYKELSQVLSISMDNVKVMLYRARKSLKEKLLKKIRGYL